MPAGEEKEKGNALCFQPLVATGAPPPWPPPTKITEQFQTRAGTFREKLLLALHRNIGKQVPVPTLIKSVYGKRKDVDYGALSMVLRGMELSIKKDRLPFTVNRERIDGVLTVGLLQKKR